MRLELLMTCYSPSHHELCNVLAVGSGPLILRLRLGDTRRVDAQPAMLSHRNRSILGPECSITKLDAEWELAGGHGTLPESKSY